MQQTTNTILMIRPINFRMNEQTAVNNYYQKVIDNLMPKTVNAKAQQEFDAFVEKLKSVGVKVIVVNDSEEFDTPDSIFPNNWVSFHENGDVGLYPMFAENRRLERSEAVLQAVEKAGFVIKNIVDYTDAEEEHVFLEGTGSMVLDRVNRKAYCALSPRADEDLFIEFCEDFEYMPVIFTANQTVKGERKAAGLNHGRRQASKILLAHGGYGRGPKRKRHGCHDFARRTIGAGVRSRAGRPGDVARRRRQFGR